MHQIYVGKQMVSQVLKNSPFMAHTISFPGQ